MLFTKYYSGDKIKWNEMGRACGMYGKRNACRLGYLKEGGRLEDVSIDVRII